MATIVIDLDGTLTIDDENIGYPERLANREVVERLREYHDLGFTIAIYTARNMKTHGRSVGKINALTIPVIIAWLEKNEIPYDELHVGKPWAEEGGFYVDDRAIRPDEFVNLSHSQILAITGSPGQ